LEYINAGHQPVLHFRDGDDRFSLLTRGGTPVGLLPAQEYESGQLELEPGDLFVLFTDGVVEAQNGDGEEYGQDRLVALVRENARSSAESIVSAIHSEVERFQAEGPPGDDITVIAVRIPEAPQNS
jgi:sigma-B regulation protein RsbU (phosphoserine phosphatase)